MNTISLLAVLAAVTVNVRPGEDLGAAIEKARADSKNGDKIEIVLEDGVHRLDQTVVINGSNRVMTVKAANRGKALITGGWTFKGGEMESISWVPLFRSDADAHLAKRLGDFRGECLAIDIPGNVWSNTVAGMKYRQPLDMPVFTVDGRYQPVSQWPNGEARFWPKREMDQPGGAPHQKYQHGKPVFDKDKNPVMVTNSVYITGTGREDRWDLAASEAFTYGFDGCAYAEGSCAIYAPPAGMKGVDMGRILWPCHVCRFTFRNLVEEIDQPGEWAIDTKFRKLVFYPPAGFGADSVCAFGELTKEFFIIRGDRVSVEGLVFTAKRGPGHCVLIEKGRDSQLVGCRFDGVSNGVRVSGYGNKMLSCDFENIINNASTVEGGDAKNQKFGNNLIENCKFREWGILHSGFYSDAVLIRGCGNKVRNCDMRGTPDHAVDITGADNLMEYCRIADASREYGDSGAVYVNGPFSYGTVLRYNDIGSAPGMSNGIYLDDFCCGITLYGNILRNIGYFAIFLGGGRDNVMENNLVTSSWGGIHLDNRGLWWPAWKDRQRFWANCCNGLGLTNGSPFAVSHPAMTKWMEKDGEKWITACVDNQYKNNVFFDIPGYSTSFFVCLNKEIPEARTVFEGNVVIRTQGLKPGASDLAEGFSERAPTNKHTSASSSFRPIGPGIKLVDGTPEKPIDLGFVDLPEPQFQVDDYMWEQQGWVDDDKLCAKRQAGILVKPYRVGDLTLKADAELKRLAPGFKEIPFAKIGLYKDAWREAAE